MTNPHLIVYAEDDLDDLQMVRECFESHDHIRLLHAKHGLEALDLLEDLADRQQKPCLLILDINMPLLNGKDTLVHVRNNPRLKDIPVVLFSTSSAEADKNFAAQWTAELFAKPLKHEDLNQIARLFIDKCNFEINKTKRKYAD